MKKISDLLERLNVEPNDVKLYFEAFTHSSFSNENKLDFNYQRLEFLGDAILDFLVAEYLSLHKDLKEGRMTTIRAAAVNKERLAKFSKELEFHKYIRFGNNKSDFKNNLKIFSDVFEAFIAALYYDKGLPHVRDFLLGNVFKFIDEIKNENQKNPKTILQEYLQMESRGTIKYVSKKKDNLFLIDVFHESTKFGSGKGKTKKEAEINAAKNALEILGRGKDETN